MAELMIAPYIRLGEYECGCGCRGLPPDLYEGGDIADVFNTFFEYFAMIRAEWNKPIPITSGYRCGHHNQAIGGSQASVHMSGLALDLDCKNVGEVGRLATLIDSVTHELRMGVYKDLGTFIHIDMGWSVFPRLSEKWYRSARWYL